MIVTLIALIARELYPVWIVVSTEFSYVKSMSYQKQFSR